MQHSLFFLLVNLLQLSTLHISFWFSPLGHCVKEWLRDLCLLEEAPYPCVFSVLFLQCYQSRGDSQRWETSIRRSGTVHIQVSSSHPNVTPLWPWPFLRTSAACCMGEGVRSRLCFCLSEMLMVGTCMWFFNKEWLCAWCLERQLPILEFTECSYWTMGSCSSSLILCRTILVG